MRLLAQVQQAAARDGTDAMRQLNPKFLTIPSYAEISIYEPYLAPDGTMDWKIIAENVDRNVLATEFGPGRWKQLLAGRSTRAPSPRVATGAAGAGTETAAVGTPTVEPLPAGPLPPLPSPPVARSSPRRYRIRGAPPRGRRAGPQGPRISIAPVRCRRRVPAPFPDPNEARSDDALVRTQYWPIPSGGWPPRTRAGLSLAPASDTPPFNDNSTAVSKPPSSTSPAARANAQLRLVRNGLVVNEARTGSTPGAVVSIPDNQAGPVPPGPHLRGRRTGERRGGRTAGPTGGGHRGARVSAPPAAVVASGATVGKVFSERLLDQFVGRFGAARRPVRS